MGITVHNFVINMVHRESVVIPKIEEFVNKNRLHGMMTWYKSRLRDNDLDDAVQCEAIKFYGDWV